MSEQGRPEQERQPGAGQPNASEHSPASADGTSPEYLSPAPTLSTDSFATNKRSRKRASSKGSSGRSRKRTARRILGLLSQNAKHQDKSARNEDSSKKDISSTDSAARNTSATSLLVKDLPPTDLSAKKLSAADMTEKDRSANNLSEKNLPAQSLSAKDLSTKAGTTVVQHLLPKKTFSKDVATKDQSTKDLAAKERTAKNASADDLSPQESSENRGSIQHVLRKHLTTKEPLPKDLSMKDLPVKGCAVDRLPAQDKFAEEALARDITTAAQLAANDMSEWVHGHSNNDAPGNAASNAPQGQPHVTPEQRHCQAALSFSSPSSTSPRDSASPLSAAVGSASSSSPDTNPLADQLALSVLKGRGLPLDPSQLPLSPMLEREPPRKNRRVSIVLQPIVDIISPRYRSSDSPADWHPPESVGRRAAAAAGRTSDDVFDEKRVHVYRPALKVRQRAVAEPQHQESPHLESPHQESPHLESPHLETGEDFDECPLPDILPVLYEPTTPSREQSQGVLNAAGEALSLSSEPPHWSSLDDVDVRLSRGPSRGRRASCIRHPGQPHRRGSRVSLTDVNR
ncbi:uncharacterized protein [Dermacentor andersoni]|uniref:uncharacterized protein n=1 Tax=Dermacentor andersoni TaxID=34620 RepID=UPI002417FC6F|nr:uncharacterized protein LOC129383398 [Dermacentor andersoni]